MRAAIRLVALLLAATVAAPAVAALGDDFLAGYVTALVERDLGLEVVSVEVRDGVAYVVVKSLGEQPAERIAAAISHVEGIERVEVAELDWEGEPRARAEEKGNHKGDRDGEDGLQLLPRVELFEPLMADQRQPHFWGAYQWYLDDPELTHVGSANFGETFALLGGRAWGGRWEIGVLGGVFSIFDLDAPSFDLVNSDFWIGPTLSMRTNGFSAQLRGYHQSSHLGDEYLLRNRTDRINLSYEGVDLLLSGDPWPWLRLYIGGGVIVNDHPDLHPLSAQGGVELKSPWAFLDGVVRPIAAFDYQSREENHWHEEISLVAGIQLENPDISRLRVQILASYFKGNSPNGQFWERRIETLGIGVHFHY